jgi:hypothetical protein
MPNTKKRHLPRHLLAILAVIIWSGNFIVSRGVSKQIGPVSLAFYRWFTATLIIAPFAWKKYREEKELVRVNWKYLCWVSLTGITLIQYLCVCSGTLYHSHQSCIDRNHILSHFCYHSCSDLFKREIKQVPYCRNDHLYAVLFC